MPITPSADANLLHGLAAFWTSFFRDTGHLRAYFDAAKISISQLYLDLLQATLGTSLQHAPLFDRRYFQQITLRRSNLIFVEGVTAAGDRLFHATPELVGAVPSLMNTPVAPTAILEDGRDYDVRPLGLYFRADPFALEGFPSRDVSVTAPAVFRDATVKTWEELGVKPGDFLRFSRDGAPPAVATIMEVLPGALALSRAPGGFEAPNSLTAFSGFRWEVLRAPSDGVRRENVIPATPRAVLAVTGTVTPGTKNFVVSSPASDASWVGQYLYVQDAASPSNNGLYAVNAIAAGTATLARPVNFVAGGAITASLVDYGPQVTGAVPSHALPCTYLTEDTFSVSGLRADGSPLSASDWRLDADSGRIYPLTPWSPDAPAFASFSWKLLVASGSWRNRGAWAHPIAYAVGDMVRVLTNVYVCTLAHTSSASFDNQKWALVKDWVVAFDETYTTREMSFWAPDVLVDSGTLYNNFGFLLGFQRPSSETYRAFLQGVARLFVLGPAPGRMESTLNVMAGLPVVRTDGEVFLRIEDDVIASSTTQTGRLTGRAEGRDGVLDDALNRFSAAGARFLPDDVGAVLRLRGRPARVVASVVNATTVTVAPPLTAADAATGVYWEFDHVLFKNRFVIEAAGAFSFLPEHAGKRLRILGATNDMNDTTFTILSVEGPGTLVLDAPYGVMDEAGLGWELSAEGIRTVVTSTGRYPFASSIPLLPEFDDAANEGTLSLRAFAALTRAFVVSDYVEDPSWWHRVALPPELLEMDVDTLSRRRASPTLIEHTYKAIDQAVYGDFGLRMGADENGRPGLKRFGPAVWTGADSVELDFPSGRQRATDRDVGRYLVVRTPPFQASYRITSVSTNGTALTLERFPPREAEHEAPPVTLDVSLPTLIFRRTVAFIIMDRFLKYHALRVKMDASIRLSAQAIEDLTRVTRDGAPAHVYLFVESGLQLDDVLELSDATASVTVT
jgi:hypothetical protein